MTSAEIEALELEIRHRTDLLKAENKIAKQPTSVILEAIAAEGGKPTVYADFPTGKKFPAIDEL